MRYFYWVLMSMIVSAPCYLSSAYAADSSTATLTLRDAIQLTLQNNPQLTSYQFRAQALDGERITAALKPGLHVNAELENIAGSGEFNGTDSAALTLSLSSVVELGGQRDARTHLITARQQQLVSTQRVLTLDVLAAVTRQFIALAAAQEELVILQQAQQIAQNNQATLTQLVRVGHTPEAELLRAKAALIRATIGVQHAEQSLRSQRLSLSAYWSNSQPTFTRVEADFFQFSSSASESELLHRLENNPDLAVLTRDVDVRAAQVQAAKAEGNVALGWSAGVRQMQATDDTALVVGVSVPLGAQRRASGSVTTSIAQHANAQWERDNTRIQLQAQLMSLHNAHQQALNEITLLRSDVLPLLKRAQQVTQTAFEQGRYSYLEFNLAQQELLNAQRSLIATAERAHTLNTDIERLTGDAISADETHETAPHSVLKDQP